MIRSRVVPQHESHDHAKSERQAGDNGARDAPPAARRECHPQPCHAGNRRLIFEQGRDAGEHTSCGGEHKRGAGAFRRSGRGGRARGDGERQIQHELGVRRLHVVGKPCSGCEHVQHAGNPRTRIAREQHRELARGNAGERHDDDERNPYDDDVVHACEPKYHRICGHDARRLVVDRVGVHRAAGIQPRRER